MNLFQIMSKIFKWRSLVLISVLVASTIGSYSYFSAEQSASNEVLSADEQLVAARIDDLRDLVSISGSVVFPRREKLSFGITGDVADVFY